MSRHFLRVLLALLLATAGCSEPREAVVETTEAPAEAATDELVVKCTETETKVNATTVRATAAGVRVKVIDETGEGLQLRTEYEDSEVGGWAFADPGETTLELPPGRSWLLCSERDGPEHNVAPAKSSEAVAVTVEAEPSDWASPVLDGDCQLVGHMTSDYGFDPAATPSPEDPPPEEVVRRELKWLRPSDVIERAGYRDAAGESPIYRVRREGRGTVALVRLSRLYERWVVSGSTECGDPPVN